MKQHVEIAINKTSIRRFFKEKKIDETCTRKLKAQIAARTEDQRRRFASPASWRHHSYSIVYILI